MALARRSTAAAPEGASATPARGGGVGNAQLASQLTDPAATGETHAMGLGGTSTAPTPSAQATDPLGAPTAEQLAAADAFLAGGAVGPRVLVPSTGMGGFDATFTPAANGATMLNIEVHAAVQFIDPVRPDGGGRAVPTTPEYAPIADALNGAPAARRAELLPDFQWSSAESDRQDWLNELEGQVQDAWDNQHKFHIHRTGWSWIGAEVNVDVVVAARTNRLDTDHLSVEAVKFPERSNLYGWGEDLSSFVEPGATDDAHDQSMRIASTDVGPRPDDMLRQYSIHFDEGSAALSSDEQARIRRFARTYQGAPGNAASHAVTIALEAHASSSGDAEENQRLSERRLAAVRAALATEGFTHMDERVAEVPTGEATADQTTNAARDRRVDISIDHGDAQSLAAHEFGHAFGLGDQYATTDTAGHETTVTGTGAQTGQAAAHDAATKNMLDEGGHALPGAIFENNEGIMSGGSVVMPEHYSTFHEALRTLSNIGDWALGEAAARPAAPAPDAATAADDDTSGWF